MLLPSIGCHNAVVDISSKNRRTLPWEESSMPQMFQVTPAEDADDLLWRTCPMDHQSCLPSLRHSQPPHCRDQTIGSTSRGDHQGCCRDHRQHHSSGNGTNAVAAATKWLGQKRSRPHVPHVPVSRVVPLAPTFESFDDQSKTPGCLVSCWCLHSSPRRQL